MNSLREWLQSVGLEQHSEMLHQNGIDLDVVASLDDDDLRELGLTLGDRKRFLAASAKLTQADALAGSKTPSRINAGERRHLTVMFCDLVGSTELSQQLDPETLREVMRNYQQTCGTVIERYDGHVAQYLGDGLMTYFGWPRAHEDDAERAIRAGLDIVEAVKQLSAPEPLRVRVGIATGPVVVGETGDGDASVPKLAVGETPNVAARIQGLAEADQIIIGPDTRRLVGGTFDLDDVGEHTLKGIVEPVRTWRVTGLGAAEGRFEAARGESDLTPMVGREQELGLLMERWALAQDGEGQVALLSGEPGIGKSRILSALREKLEAEGVQSLRFQCSPYYVNSAFWPSIDNIERALKFARDETPDSKLDKLESLIVTHFGRPLSDVRFVAAMLSVPCDERYGEVSMTPQKFKDETMRTLVDLTEAAASKQPTVMLYEDLHWADPTTLEVVDLLIDRVKDVPLLIVFTHRPEFQNRWSDHGHVTGLNLSKLTRVQSAAMISRVAGGKALPNDLVEQVLSKTDGVPLFVEELTKSILESGELKEEADRYDYAGNHQGVTIPATLRDSLMARLDRFMPVKEIAQIGAVIGREFSYELISAVTPIPRGQLDDALAQLSDSGLAFRRGTPPHAVYTFKHALVQDAAYESLLKSNRQSLHRRIAEVLAGNSDGTVESQPELLARHYEAAGMFDAAIPLFLKAGQIELSRWASDEAIAHLSKGVELLRTQTPNEDRNLRELDFQIGLGAALGRRHGWASQEFAASSRRATELRGGIEDVDRLFPLVFRDWVFHLVTGDMAALRASTHEVHKVAQSHGSDVLFAFAESSSVLLAFFAGDFQAALKAMERLLTVYDEERHFRYSRYTDVDMKVLAQLYQSQTLWILGYADQARQVCDEMVAAARRQGIDFQLSWILGWGNSAYQYCGQIDEFAKRVNESMAIATEHHFTSVTSQGNCFKGWTMAKRGQLADGLAHIQQGLRAWEGSGAGICTPHFRTFYAQILGDVGQTTDALVEIEKAEAQIASWQECWGQAETLRTKGELLLIHEAPDVQQSEESFQKSLDVAQSQSAKGWELRAATSLARLWMSQGKGKEAHDLLAPVYEWFTEGFDTKDLKEAKALLEELAQ
jgi:class 3 adenylate cyclase/predicted ATPase